MYIYIYIHTYIYIYYIIICNYLYVHTYIYERVAFWKSFDLHLLQYQIYYKKSAKSACLTNEKFNLTQKGICKNQNTSHKQSKKALSNYNNSKTKQI